MNKQPILSINTIASVFPEEIIKLIRNYGLNGCVIPNVGYCDTIKCHENKDLLPSTIHPTCNCAFFTFLANLYIGSIAKTKIILTQNTLNVATSKQTIVFKLITEGDITGSFKFDQTQDVNIVSITEKNIQDSLANISCECIQEIINESERNPNIFKDQISQEILERFKSTDCESVKSNVDQYLQKHITENDNNQNTVVSSSIIRNINVSENHIYLYLDIKQFEGIEQDISQQIAIDILSKNIVDIVISGTLDTIMGDDFEKIMSQVKTICFTEKVVPTRTSLEPLNTTMKPQKNTGIIILSCVLGFVFCCFFIAIIVLFFKKTTTK